MIELLEPPMQLADLALQVAQTLFQRVNTPR
jgi:hypothetical protein